MTFVHEIPSAVVGAVVLRIGVDPVGDAQQLFSAEPDLFVDLSQPFDTLEPFGGTLNLNGPFRHEHRHQDAVVRTQGTGGKIVDIPGLRVVLPDGRNEVWCPPVLSSVATLVDEVLVGGAEEACRGRGQIESARFLFRGMAGDAVAVEDRLDICRIVQHAPPDLLPWLGTGEGGFPRKREQTALGRGRGVFRRLMAADAGTVLAGHEVDKGPFGLHREVVLVQRLEEDVGIRGNEEIRAAVFFDGDDSMLHLQPEGRVLGDHRVLLVVGLGGTVLFVVWSARIPGTGDLFEDPEIADGAAFDIFHAHIDILNHTLREFLLSEDRVERGFEIRGTRPGLQGNRLPCGDIGVAIEGNNLPLSVEGVESIAVGLIGLAEASRFMRDEDEFWIDRPRVTEKRSLLRFPGNHRAAFCNRIGG